jgi:hypothetical protein
VEGSGSLQLNNVTSTAQVKYVELSQFTPPTTFTVSMWVLINTGKSPNTHRIYSFNTGDQTSTGIFFQYFDSWLMSVSNKSVGSGFALTAGWLNFMLTYNNGSITFYQNQVSKGTLSNTTIHGTNLTNHFIGRLGTDPQTDFTQYALDGYIDDFRFYNRVLSAAEMTTVYNYVSYVQYTVTFSVASLYLKKFSGNPILNPTITFRAGTTYIFDQSDSSNATKQIVFTINSNGTGTIYNSTNGVTIIGTPGQSGAYTKLVLSGSFTGNLYYSSRTVS